MLSKIAPWARLIFELGMDVIDAARTGQTDRTVGEILADRVPDMAEIDRLEQEARDHFGE